MKLFAGWVLLASSLVPRIALACPMCFNGKDSNTMAFVYGSIMLMLVPTTVIGGLLYWAYQRAKAADADPFPYETVETRTVGAAPSSPVGADIDVKTVAPVVAVTESHAHPLPLHVVPRESR